MIKGNLDISIVHT